MADSLTTDQILGMAAGPELDALVAVRVMGFKAKADWEFHQDKGMDWVAPAYSTEIAAAMEVLDKWADPGRHGGYGEGGIFWEGSRDDWTWCCELGVVVKAHAPTAPLAICRAALLSMSHR